MNRAICMTILGSVLLLAIGCSENATYMTPERQNEGLVVILPGIEGVSQLNKDIRDGFSLAGIDYAMPIRSWGRPIPLIGMAISQVDVLGNRLAAMGLAKDIMKYQDEYPGRPVYVVGHSGGGGIAVFVAEYMDEGRQIDGVLVLSGSISKGYNLEKALGNTRQGIVNFYNPKDAGLLAVGTTIMGCVDGGHGLAAGLVSFDDPKDKDSVDKKVAYAKLHQVEITSDMTLGGDTHTAVTQPAFVSIFVATWISSEHWPAAYCRTYNYDPTREEINQLIEEDKPLPGDEAIYAEMPKVLRDYREAVQDEEHRDQRQLDGPMSNEPTLDD
jgi:pimeloyl-ACP methyl ester carboxylesterase